MELSDRGKLNHNRGTSVASEKNMDTELIIVDAAVEDYGHLLQGLDSHMEVLVLDGGRDGLAQMAQALAGREGIRALHILSHGGAGRLELGSASVDLAALDRYKGELEAMGRALAPGGDILVYGCEVAKGEKGQAFISALGRTTGADVAASQDTTGPDRLGGDWILETQTGSIEASLPFSDPALSRFSHTLAAFTERFEWASYSNCERLAHTSKAGIPTFKDFTAGGTSFRISTTPDGDGGDIKYGRGGSPINGSIKFDSVKTDTNTIERFTITRADGADWTLSTLDYSCSIRNKNVKVEAFLNGNRVQSNWLGGWDQTLNFRNKAVDTLVFSGENFDFFEIDNLVGDSTLLPPTQLRSHHNGVLEGGIDTISKWELSYKDQLSSDPNIIYTLDWMTGNGRLFMDKNGNNVAEALEYLYNGYRVSQQEINDGKLKYEHCGSETTSDSFEFSVTNERGLSTVGQRFDLTVFPVNDAPILTATQTNPEFMEAGPVTLFTTARVGMWEAGQSITGLTLTVANVTDPTEGLAMDGSFIPLTNGATGTTSSHGLNYTVSLAGGTATVTLAGSLSTAAAQTLINTMGYDNTSQDPGTENARVVTLTSLRDSGGTANGGEDTVITSIASTVTLKGINDAPALSATGLDPAFQEGGGAVQLFSGTSVDTIEAGQEISRMIITLTHVAGDGSREFLSVDGTEVSLADGSGTTAAGGFDYIVTLSSGTASVEITKIDTAAAYASLVNGLAYKNTGTGLDNNPRKADITLIQDTGGTADGGSDTNTGLTATSTVDVHPSPVITDIQYDWQAGTLALTGTDFVSSPGAGNDIDASDFTITGAKGFQYTLTDTPDAEITGPGSAILFLGPADRLAVQSLLNKDGSHAVSGTAYNLAAAEDWMTGSPAPAEIADPVTALTVTHHVLPAITSAVYDFDTGVLTVTGTHFVKNPDIGKDVDISALTLSGGAGNEVYTITSSADVDILGPTEFCLTLTGTDKTGVDNLLDQVGTVSAGHSTYNLSAGDDWMTGADAAADISDPSNGVTVFIKPKITSAAYDAGSGVLTVTGTHIQANGGDKDIRASNLTLTGEGGETYTLTDTPDVDRDNINGFTLNLSPTDKAGLNQIINRDGRDATNGTVYNLAAEHGWNTNVTAGDTADITNVVTASNVPAPTITSAAYNAGTGVLTVTGTGFVKKEGTANDIDVTKLALTGEGGETYTLTTSSDMDITGGTEFTITLSSADKSWVNQILNKNGNESTTGITYNLEAAEDWAAGADPGVNVADVSGNGLMVTNVALPEITSATYHTETGALVVKGSNFVKRPGADNDIDVSALTLTGQAGATHTLTLSDVDIDSDTLFKIILTGADKTGVDTLLDQIGTASSDGSTYNLAAGDDWMTGADAAADISDPSNAVTVFINPKITSAAYDAGSGVLTVTGTHIQANGRGMDIRASNLTLTGEGGETYTLTDTPDVNRDNINGFTLNLSPTDKAGLNQIINRDGTDATNGTAYNLAAEHGWNTNVTAGDTADITNVVTASNVPAPTITSAAYNASTGVLTVTGTGFVKKEGAANDIDITKLALTGKDGETYTLTTSSDMDITSGTEFTITLSSSDKSWVNQILDKNGNESTTGTTYNLEAAEDWAAGADPGVNVADLSGNGLMVKNIALPKIISATYHTGTGALVVKGSNLVKCPGGDNDIDVSALTLTGQAGATHTLTLSDVDIDSDTRFKVILTGTDKTAVDSLFNKNGLSSADNTTYNLSAAEDWAAGTDADETIADTSGNAVTVTIYVPPPPAPPRMVDGVHVETRTATSENSDNKIVETIIAPVTDSRQEDGTTANDQLADIPLLFSDPSNDLAATTVSLPSGVGLNAYGPAEALSRADALLELLPLIQSVGESQDETNTARLVQGGQGFLSDISENTQILAHHITLTTNLSTPSDNAIIITGSPTSSDGDADVAQALVIDASDLPRGTQLHLENVAFAVIIGPATLRGGTGANIVYAGSGNQDILLGPDDDELYGGEGDDIVGSAGGDDRIFGENGSDTIFGGNGADLLHGGYGTDTVSVSGSIKDYTVVQDHAEIRVVSLSDPSDTDLLINVETIRFDDASFVPAYQPSHISIATLYQQVFDRQPDLDGYQYWAQSIENGQTTGDTAVNFLRIKNEVDQAPAFDSLDNEGKINQFYHSFLGRPADTEGLEYWLNSLETGQSLESIAQVFIEDCIEIQGVRAAPELWDFTL